MTSEDVQGIIISKLRDDAALETPILLPLTNQQVVESLSAMDPALATTKACKVDTQTAKGILMAFPGAWPKIGLGSQTASLGDLQGLFYTIYGALTELDFLATDNPVMLAVITAALEGCVQAGVIDELIKDSLLALGLLPVDRSWCDINIEGRVLDEAQVASARVTLASE